MRCVVLFCWAVPQSELASVMTGAKFIATFALFLSSEAAECLRDAAVSLSWLTDALPPSSSFGAPLHWELNLEISGQQKNEEIVYQFCSEKNRLGMGKLIDCPLM